MPIQLCCSCGRQLKIADEYTGKRIKCPSCGAAQSVPAADSVEYDVEIVEEAPPAAVSPAPRQPARAKPALEAEATKPPRGKKKRKRGSAGEKEGSLAQMYMEQARHDLRRDEGRARAAGSWGRDEDGGRTLFGIHVTAGVLAGAGMLFTGLLAMAIIAIFRDELVLAPRLFIAAIAGTTLGGITLIKSLFFGEED
jgi:hypothetical protein